MYGPRRMPVVREAARTFWIADWLAWDNRRYPRDEKVDVGLQRARKPFIERPGAAQSHITI